MLGGGIPASVARLPGVARVRAIEVAPHAEPPAQFASPLAAFLHARENTRIDVHACRAFKASMRSNFAGRSSARVQNETAPPLSRSSGIARTSIMSPGAHATAAYRANWSCRQRRRAHAFTLSRFRRFRLDSVHLCRVQRRRFQFLSARPVCADPAGQVPERVSLLPKPGVIIGQVERETAAQFGFGQFTPRYSLPNFPRRAQVRPDPQRVRSGFAVRVNPPSPHGRPRRLPGRPPFRLRSRMRSMARKCCMFLVLLPVGSNRSTPILAIWRLRNWRLSVFRPDTPFQR